MIRLEPASTPPGHEYRPDDRLVLVLNPVQGPAANAVVRRVEDRDRLQDLGHE